MQDPISALPGVFAPSQASIFVHVAVLSVALERVIQILKGFLPFWPFNGARSNLRKAVMIVITAAIGTGFCWKFHLNVLHIQHVRTGYLAVGLAAAAGAAFWHNLLGLMRAAAAQKESQAAAGK